MRNFKSLVLGLVLVSLTGLAMAEINMNYFGAFIVLLIGGLLSYIFHSTSKCPECGRQITPIQP